MKRLFSLIMGGFILLSGCSAAGKEENKELMFWSAPNAQQLAHWTKLANSYNETNPEYKIVVQQMPETPSSEAGIQNALASGEAPIASENIMRGFATELANSDAIIDLSTFDGYKEIISNRKMEDIMTGWEVNGAQYVIPIFSNPMLVKWRIDLLKEVGVNEMPKTYADVLSIADKIAKDGRDSYAYYGNTITFPQNWWERWYDFFMYYNAQSNGAEFIVDGKLVADDEAAIKALSLFAALAQKDNGILTNESIDPVESGTVFGNVSGPWAIPVNLEKYPELKYLENYDYSLPVNENGNATKTFADSKGVVIYSHASDTQIKGMLEFFNYVFTESNDLNLLEMTNMPPARSDLLENPLFADYFSANPEVAAYADQVINAIPAMADHRFVDIQEKIGERMLKMITDNISPETTWEDIKVDIASVISE